MGSAVKLMGIVAQGQGLEVNRGVEIIASVAGGSEGWGFQSRAQAVDGVDGHALRSLLRCLLCQYSCHEKIRRDLRGCSCSLHDFVNFCPVCNPKISCAGRARVTVSKGAANESRNKKMEGQIPGWLGWA